MGMEHDFVSYNGQNYKRIDRNRFGCSSIDGVMDYDSKRTIWSSCSVQDFSDYFVNEQRTQGKFCLSSFDDDHWSHGFTKIAVANGKNIHHHSIEDIEVIDISSTRTKCHNLPNLLLNNHDSIGGLDHSNNPIICGGYYRTGQACQTLRNESWVYEKPFQDGRWLFAMTKSPFYGNRKGLFVTGGNMPAGNGISTEVLTEIGWQRSVPMPVHVVNHCMVKFNSTSVMVISGARETHLNRLFTTYIFNSETGKWTNGPPVIQARIDHSCAMIRNGPETFAKSIIMVGGWDYPRYNYFTNTETLDTEILSSFWQNGPKLPIGMAYIALVEDAAGGVITIGGLGQGVGPLNTLYRLPHLGKGSSWIEMPQRLKTPRYRHTAFFIPDSLANSYKTKP